MMHGQNTPRYPLNDKSIAAEKEPNRKSYVRNLFRQAGIDIDGRNAYDIQVRNPRFYEKVLADGPLGFGEAYMEGWWDCGDIEEMVVRVTVNDLEKKLKLSWKFLWENLKARIVNLQSQTRAPRIGRKHYDATLQAYESMAGKWAALSCGYWKSAKTLDAAQEAKFDLICKKLGIGAHDRVLDIGCGFGSFARFAAERYGCTVTGINISPQQAERARLFCAGLPVTIYTCDYRDSNTYLQGGKFDKIVSIGMFEHVGYKNYRQYFKVASDCLQDNGIFLLHTIGSNVSLVHNDPWFEKYIFPGGQLPSVKQIGKALEGLFVMEDWHNFGYDYALTLESWHENFQRNWEGSKQDPFYRMWTYYLLSCAGYFKARRIQLWQLVLSKNGVAGGYSSIR
ncbi:MAG: cyclopropane fatty acyl phospholipid synthase [Gammaproteobacteria bacterium]